MLQVSDIDGNGSLSFIGQSYRDDYYMMLINTLIMYKNLEFTVLMEVLKNVHDDNHGHSHQFTDYTTVHY